LDVYLSLLKIGKEGPVIPRGKEASIILKGEEAPCP
jgi:hypothetical protein